MFYWVVVNVPVFVGVMVVLVFIHSIF